MTAELCTAAGEQRTWDPDAWLAGRGACPDCGRDVAVRVNGSDLLPHAKASRHRPPVGVTPGPYAVHPRGRASAHVQE